MSHVLLQILDFIRQEEGVWHEAVVYWEKPLQSTNDDTENVFLCEMVHQRVTVNQSSLHLDQFDVAVT